MAAEQKRKLVPRGAPNMPIISPGLLHPNLNNIKNEQNDDRQDSGLGESYKSESNSRESNTEDGITILEDITSQMTINDDIEPLLCKNASNNVRHHEPCPTPQTTQTTTASTVSPSMANPILGMMNFAQSNDVCWLLAPYRHCLMVQNEDGDTPIHLAIIHCLPHIDAFVSIAPNKECLNIYNHLRQTPLHLAVITRQPSVVSLLLSAGASIDLVDRSGKTALHLASERGDVDIIRMLTQSVINIHGGESWALEILLNAREYKGFSALQLAVMADSFEAVGLLVSLGAKVDFPDGTSGRTALHLAVENDDLKMVNYLLFNCGASVNAQRYDECTAIHTAAGRGMLAITGRLLAAGADLSIANSENETPLDHATPEVLEALKHYL